MRQHDDAGAGPRSLKPLDDIPAGYVGKPREVAASGKHERPAIPRWTHVPHLATRERLA
jgi:hypothetical protein